LPTPGHFMWLRPHPGNPLRDDNAFAATIDHDHATQRSTQLDPGALDHPDLRFLLQLRDPTIQAIWRTHRGSAELLCVHSQDGTWAEVDTTERDGRHTVTQGGPRHIWDQVEATAAHWSHLGHPRADRFGLTATTDQHWFWLDTPEFPAFD
ncbi:MAG: methyltransferase domain-containing protein, partial [Candidatus Dormibacteria bacterium]